MADSDDDEVSSTTDPVVSSVATLIANPGSDEMVVGSVDSIVKVDIPDEGTMSGESLAVTSVSPSLANPTLHGLLSTPVSITNSQLLNPAEAIQIITVSNPNDLLSVTTASPDGRIWQVVHPEMATIITVGDPAEIEPKAEMSVTDTGVDIDEQDSIVANEMSAVSAQDAILMPPPPPPPQLPQDCPLWAQRMKCCEKIGDSYRGYVETESELDLLLTYHKQQTQSFWGTRQSPSPAKPSTRLMWKSQYVPFDGQPFVNSGSRAVVMECQFGPRRKGNFSKKQEVNPQIEYKQTCPARIYIKKVKKFPEYAVDMTLDKKSLKTAMDKAFHELKQRGSEGIGQERYYVQLPTEKAHEFHSDISSAIASPVISFEQQEYDVVTTRLDPRIINKIRDLVAAGEHRVYAVRKALRNYVTREMYHGGEVPERHDLTLFPTVNDLKNQIHQALKDIDAGNLQLTSPPVNVDMISNSDSTQSHGESVVPWQTGSGTGDDGSEPVPETVTVTLTQNPGEDGHHVISRIETHLSDGSTRVSTTLTPETAQLLSRLHPNMFPASFLLQQQLDPAVSSLSDADGVVLKTENQNPQFPGQDVDPGVPIDNESVVVHGDSEINRSDSSMINSDSKIDHSDSVLSHSDSVLSHSDSVMSVGPLHIVDADITSTRQDDTVDSLHEMDLEHSSDTEVVNSEDVANMSTDDASQYVAVSLSSDNGEHILSEASISNF